MGTAVCTHATSTTASATASFFTFPSSFFRLATCLFSAANCLAVGPVACRLPGAAATYIVPATAATPTSIQKRFIDPPFRPRELRGNAKDSTTPSARCQPDDGVARRRPRLRRERHLDDKSLSSD